jgi:hypothetical protein
MFLVRNSFKQDALSPLVCFASKQAISRVQVNQDGLKLISTHQFLVYADDVHIFGGSVSTVMGNADRLVEASRKTGLEVNKTKYMVRSRDQNAGQRYSIKTDNSSFEKVEEFKYLEKILTEQNYTQEKIKSNLKQLGAESFVF